MLCFAGMSYKGIELLTAIGPAFAVWEVDVLGYLQRNHRLACAIVVADDALAALEDVNDARLAGQHALDAEAGSVIRLFMVTELKLKYNHLKTGFALWSRLKSDFLSYQTANANVIDKQLRHVGPNPGETVAVYIARAEVLSRQLTALGRTVDATQLRDLVWEGLERERPAWESTVEALRVTMRDSTLTDISAQMSRLEVSKAALAPDAAAAFAAQAPAPPRPAPAAVTVEALAAEFAALRAELAARPVPAATRPAPRYPARRGASSGPRNCYVCGSSEHLALDCPRRHGAAPSPMCMRASVSALLRWLLDSGTNRHIHPGGRGVFQNYRALQQPVAVRFGKRGSVSHAVGEGDVLEHGPSGPVLLRNVLHVPDLVSPLFSVSCALDDGVSVHFDAPEQRGGEHTVVLRHAGRVIFTASLHGGMYLLDTPHHACAAMADEQAMAVAEQWHRRLGHKGFASLADLVRLGLLDGCDVTPAQFLQARERSVCEPCIVGKLQRASHPLRVPRPVPLLYRVHTDVCEFPSASGPTHRFVTLIDEATRFSCVTPLLRKSDAADAVRNMIAWCEKQTGQSVLRVRNDRGGEFMVGALQAYYAQRGIQMEPTPPYTPEANGMAESHNGVLLKMALPMLADSGDAARGLAPLGPQHAVDAVLYANDVHIATPSSGAQLGRTPHEGFLGVAVQLGAFRRFGCRVWVHNPGKPHKHRSKLAPRGLPGRLLGFERPLGSGIYRVKLDGGGVVAAQRVVFDESVRLPRPPSCPPPPAGPAAPAPSGGGEADDDHDDDSDAPVHGGDTPEGPAAAAQPPDMAPQPAEPEPVVVEAPAEQPQAAAPVPELPQPALLVPPAHAPVPAPASAHGRPVRATRNQQPRYADAPRRGAHARAATAQPHVRWSTPLATVLEERPAELQRFGERGASQRARAEAPCPPPAEPIRSQPFLRPPRTGGPSRGTTERLRQPLGRMGMAPLRPRWGVMGQRVEAAVLPNPTSVEEALSRPDAAEWQAAIDVELSACLRFGVWEQSELPPGKQALPSRVLFERKRDGRYKVRLVAGGHRQQHGLDFEGTYAPVCSYRTMRMVLAVAAHEDLELRQFDVRTAFLNGELEEEVYMRPPAGCEHLVSGRRRVLRLRRALYGLRQASRAWNKRLEAALKSRGFTQSDADPSLWILHGEGGAVFAMFYVDDGLVAARTAAEADALVDMIAAMFEIRALGQPEDFLGIRITRDRAGRTITISQTDKALALAAAAGVSGERRDVPMTQDVYAALRAWQPGEELADVEQYQSAIGSLLHLAQCTRPDIAHAVGALASYSAAPTKAHWAAALGVVSYVGSTAQRGITFGRSQEAVQLWCDANFAACRDTRRSTTGWVVTMYGGAVSWSSKKQPTVAASTMEAEYQACGSVAREGDSVLKQLRELAYFSSDFNIKGPLTILCDNKAALTLCNERKEGQRVKHIDIIHHFAREHVASGILQFMYCRSADNVSDCLTKALTRPGFEANLRGLGMLLD